MLSDLIIQEFIRTGRLADTVACLGNCDLDCPRADRQGSDNLVASDRDDLVGADVGQWRRCFNIELSDHRVGTRSSLQGKGDIAEFAWLRGSHGLLDLLPLADRLGSRGRVATRIRQRGSACGT